MGITTSQFRNGLTLQYEGEIYVIVEFQHIKPGKGQAFVRTRLKNIKTGSVIQKNFRIGEEFEPAHLDRREMEFLYDDGENYYFMDNRDYEQIAIPASQIEEVIEWLTPNMVCEVLMFEGRPVVVNPPDFVELEVVETDPGVKGDTQSGGTKPAKLETGKVIQVPLFIKVGDRVRVDTRTGSYVTRV
jgi:elongation factor P